MTRAKGAAGASITVRISERGKVMTDKQNDAPEHLRLDAGRHPCFLENCKVCERDRFTGYTRDDKVTAAIAEEREQWIAELQRIHDIAMRDSECDCEHDTDFCCARVNEPCVVCVTALALKGNGTMVLKSIQTKVLDEAIAIVERLLLMGELRRDLIAALEAAKAGKK
jgi:hypothetical protein